MKRFHFCLPLVVVFSTVLFGGCNTVIDKIENENISDDSATYRVTELPTAAQKSNVLIIQHKIANYANWKNQYDADDSTRQSYGLKNYVVGRGINDSNIIITFLKMEDMQRASALMISDALKNSMQKAGVLDIPTFLYMEVMYNDSSFIDQTARILITHKVKECTAWKKIFDEQQPERMKAGLIDRGLGYSLNDKNLVGIVLAITDFKKASAYGNSPDLKDKMMAAGVDGQTAFFHYNIVQKY